MHRKVCQDKCPASFHWAAPQLLPIGVTPPSSWFTSREGVTLSPSRSHRAFLEHGRKEAYHSRSGKLPGFTSTTQKALASQISGVAQGRAVGVFLVSTQAHKGMQTSHFALVLANSTRPTLVCIRGFLVRWRAKPKSFQEAPNGKKSAGVGFLLPTEEPHSKASMETLPCSALYALCNIQTMFKESEDLRGVGWTFYYFCLSPGSCRHHSLIFTCITCPGLHFSSSVLYHRAQWTASFCPPLGNWAVMKPVKPVSHCNLTQAGLTGLRNTALD